MTNGITKLFEFDIVGRFLSILGFLFVFLTTILGIDLDDVLTKFQKGMLAGALLLFAVLVLLHLIDKRYNIFSGVK